MAVKVIDPTPDPRIVQHTSCPNCGARLEYTPADTRFETRRDYTGDSSTYTKIDCPACKAAITVGLR